MILRKLKSESLSNQLSFECGIPPAHYQFLYEPFLYNYSSYNFLQSPDKTTFYIADHQAGNVLGMMHVFIENGVAYSPYKSPFGSLEFWEGLDLGQLTQFAEFLMKTLEKAGIKKIIIKNYALVYGCHAIRWVYALLKSGFSISEFQINHHLRIDELPFEEKIRSMERRRISKCIQGGLLCREYPQKGFRKIYDFIATARRKKGIPFTMSFSVLEESIKAFPDNYLFFAVMKGGEIIAATIVVKVNSTILYNYCPTTDQSWKSFSPAVLISKSIYEYGQFNQFKIFDYGFAGDNPTLFQFKENMGGEKSNKYTLEYSIL